MVMVMALKKNIHYTHPTATFNMQPALCQAQIMLQIMPTSLNPKKIRVQIRRARDNIRLTQKQ
jgi:hypothetical protein